MKLVSLMNLPNFSVSHNPALQKKVMLQPGDLPNLIYFSQAEFPPGEVASAHSHTDMSEVFFVESGTGIIRINEREYPLQTGTMVAVEPEEVHEIINNGTTPLKLIYFAIKAQLE